MKRRICVVTPEQVLKMHGGRVWDALIDLGWQRGLEQGLIESDDNELTQINIEHTPDGFVLYANDIRKQYRVTLESRMVLEIVVQADCEDHATNQVYEMTPQEVMQNGRVITSTYSADAEEI